MAASRGRRVPRTSAGFPDVEKSISDLEYKWAEAQKAGKPDVVAPLLADRFVNTDTDGKVSGETLAGQSQRRQMGTQRNQRCESGCLGHVAIATGAWAGKGIDGDGTKIDRRERWTDTWVRMPGGLWQCVASQQTELKP